MNLEDFLVGRKVLAKTHSKINGDIEVIREFAWGTYIQVGGLTQSGGVLESVWSASLKYIAGKPDYHPRNLLVIGLGGGTLPKLAKGFWPKIEITGVDIDPIMIDLGKKYLNLDKYKVNTIIADGQDYIQKMIKTKKKFDLICIDTYVGSSYPKKFESQEFINSTKKIVSKKGYIIFNRLYYGEKKENANRFEKMLLKNFSQVVRIYPKANVMFVCK